MKKEVVIYHGSISIIEKPIFGYGKPYNDYGMGFYCTESLDLAKEWAVSEGKNGYANKYKLDLTGLKTGDYRKITKKEVNVLYNLSFCFKKSINCVKNGKNSVLSVFINASNDLVNELTISFSNSSNTA